MPEINSPEESPEIDQSNTRRSAFSRMLDSVIETGRVILDLRAGGRRAHRPRGVTRRLSVPGDEAPRRRPERRRPERRRR